MNLSRDDPSGILPNSSGRPEVFNSILKSAVMSQSETPPIKHLSPHTAFKALPIVDISGLFSEDKESRQAAANALDKAAREAGFLYLTGHGVSDESIEALKRSAKTFFAQTEAFKSSVYIGNSVNHSGYVPMGEEQFYGSSKIDAKESYDVGFELTDLTHQRPMLGPNQWPELANFREGVQGYYEQVLALSKKLFSGFSLALGLEEDYFAPYLKAPANQLRLIHYFHNSEQQEDRPGIGAHTDYEFFTILLPTSPGLQVLNGAGEWIDAPIVPGAFVVNIGDMMEILSNGEYVATSHRVKKVREERYAFPMFCNLDYDTKVEPLEKFRKTHTKKYSPVICGEHLFAQTIQTFKYLQKKVAKGDIELPSGAIDLSSFGNFHIEKDNGNQEN